MLNLQTLFLKELTYSIIDCALSLLAHCYCSPVLFFSLLLSFFSLPFLGAVTTYTPSLARINCSSTQTTWTPVCSSTAAPCSRTSPNEVVRSLCPCLYLSLRSNSRNNCISSSSSKQGVRPRPHLCSVCPLQQLTMEVFE